MSDELIVTINDVRRAKMCSSGARQFFIDHNLDWSRFISEGLPASIIESTNDAMAMQVVEVAKNGRR